MSEAQNSNADPSSQENPDPDSSVEIGLPPGPISQWLSSRQLNHIVLEADHIGVENIGIEPNNLIKIATALKGYGFDYLQCQGGYDEGPGSKLVSFYHLIAIGECLETHSGPNKNTTVREVRLKVFLARNGDLRVPSLYGLFRGADWQERETYDMFGIQFDDHPHPKRLLMPEDWKGWPLRKDYIQPDFYEMQDAY